MKTGQQAWEAAYRAALAVLRTENIDDRRARDTASAIATVVKMQTDGEDAPLRDPDGKAERAAVAAVR